MKKLNQVPCYQMINLLLLWSRKYIKKGEKTNVSYVSAKEYTYQWFNKNGSIYIYITNKDKITTGKFMTFNVHFVFLQGYIWVIYCLF